MSKKKTTRKKRTKKKAAKRTAPKYPSWQGPSNFPDGPFVSGINPQSSMSYQRYMEEGLAFIHKTFKLKVYRRADATEYPTFIPKKDLRVQIRWGDDIKHEWLVTKEFFERGNSKKEDREYMRGHADMYLQAAKNACDIARAKHKAVQLKKTKKKRTKKAKAK